MTKKISLSTCLILVMLFLAGTVQQVLAQSDTIKITGTVIESGSGNPLAQAAVSVTSTGTTAITDDEGTFTLVVPDTKSEIIVDMPGYSRRSIFLNGRTDVRISMVDEKYQSMDDPFNNSIGSQLVKDAAFSSKVLTQEEMKLGAFSSFDQALQGKVPGMQVVEQSGMPGHRTYMNIRGYSSLHGESEPLLFIDGMIHNYSYARNGLMEGFALNPMDVVDIEDISDISILKDGVSHLGSAGSNGAIYVNTEQKAEASTIIKFSAYGGLTLVPKSQDLMNPGQFDNYFNEVLTTEGYSQDQINTMYPWLHGSPGVDGYYKYNNETDWQDEIYNPASLWKGYFFLKGGDDIATYNVSTGYMSQKGIVDNSAYSRFNLRINGKVNITDRFSVTPNAKLSLADSRVANHGPTSTINPIASAFMKAPTMDPIARDNATGEYLTYYDDVGVFNKSNPAAIVNNAMGENRNYHFLASIKAAYQFNDNFALSTLFGLNFNNSRETRFLPDLGIVSSDSIYNSPGEFVNEFRSTQNHTTLTYTNRTASGHSIAANLGFRYMANSYKYNKSISLNTPSDEFKKIQDNAQYPFLRTTIGDDREMSWISTFLDAHYNFRSKYYLSTSLAYDASSVTNDLNRWNFFPSVGAAWRLSSESFMNNSNWLEDLKIRGSYSITGNRFSTVYDYSKMYYADRRMNATGVVLREAIPNENLELEKKNTINAGLDLSIFKQALNLHVDYFVSNVNNLIVKQELPSSFGFTDYYDNGGVLNTNGFEIALDARLQAGQFTWIIGGSISKIASTVTSLEFLNPAAENIITDFPGGQFITEVDGSLNSYYGYVTDGLISSAEAGSIIGPRGIPMEEGDVKFEDVDDNGIINEADKQVLGDPNPDFFGSIFTTLSWKNVELFLNFNYAVGNELYNHTRTYTEGMYDYANQSTKVLDRWTPSNMDADLPRISQGDPTGNTVFSDRWIEDGSYLRLGQLTVNYYFPKREGWFNGITVYLTATNLLTLTNYSGNDPEFSYMNSPFIQGVDYGLMPGAKTFIIGLKLDL